MLHGAVQHSAKQPYVVFEQIKRHCPLHNFVFMGCHLVPATAHLAQGRKRVDVDLQNVDEEWHRSEPYFFVITKDRVLVSSIFDHKKPNVSEVVKATDYVAKRHSLEVAGAIGHLDVMPPLTATWLSHLAKCPPENSKALENVDNVFTFIFSAEQDNIAIEQANADLALHRDRFMDQSIDKNVIERSCDINLMPYDVSGELPEIERTVGSEKFVLPGITHSDVRGLAFTRTELISFLSVCNARGIKHPPCLR